MGIVNGPSDGEEEPNWNEDFADDQDYELSMQGEPGMTNHGAGVAR